MTIRDVEARESSLEEELHLYLLASVPSGSPVLDLLGELGEVPAGVDALTASLRLARAEAARAEAVMVAYAARIAASDLLSRADEHGEVSAAVEEVAMALRVSRLMASRLIRVGRATAGVLAGTGAVMASGLVGFDKAWALVDALGEVHPAVALAVEEIVLPRLPERTPTEIRRDVARALIEVDGANADSRREVATRGRHVGRPRLDADGMASMRLLLPAEDAVTLDAALDAAARTAGPGGGRTHGQLRADALTAWARDVVAGRWAVTAPDGTPCPVGPVPAAVRVTVPLEVLAQALPGWETHPSPADAVHAEMTGEEPVPGRVGRTEAAWLEGYGPIAPAVARLLAAGGTWRRIVTDGPTGTPLDVGRTRYQPPPGLAEAVRLRDPVCARPGCSTPAGRCDLDHVTEWHDGGATSLSNLAPLCPRCHRLKTLGAGTESPPHEGGTRTWTTPTGTRYIRHPERHPRTRHTRGKTEIPGGEQPPERTPHAVDGTAEHGLPGGHTGSDPADGPPPF